VLWDVPGLAALVATLFFVQAGMSAISPILPLFVQTLLPGGHGSVASLAGLVVGVSAVTSALAAGVAGKIGDRIGHERVLACCAIGGGLLYLPQALVTSPWQLLVLRGGLGLFTGGLMPGVMATIALRTPLARRGWVFGLTSTATSLGNAVGPVAGAAAATAFGLRASFVLTAAVLTAAGVWVALSLGPRRSRSPSALSRRADDGGRMQHGQRGQRWQRGEPPANA
jgi:DHA1 family multidrug resistance protein-like MFS transporter